jgi:HAD superfamily hydrolase (TIGR01490 family)
VSVPDAVEDDASENSAEAHEEAIPSPYVPRDRAAAFFDLDRTLISGASAFTFGVAAWRQKMVPTRQFAKDAAGAIAFKLFGASDDQAGKARDRLLGAVAGVRQADLVALNPHIVPKLLDEVRPEAADLLELHRRAGRDTYIVSASPQEMVEPLATSLGMTGGIGTVAEVRDGVYTGALAGPFCYGPGKVEAIRELSEWEGYDLGRCYAYSDSASDLPMLEAVGHPVAVNPDSALERVARRNGWPIVIFRRRTRMVIRRVTTTVGAGALAAGSLAGGIAIGRHYERGRPG